MGGDPDYRAIFEGLPGLYLVLDTSYVIVAVSDAYLRATSLTRRGLVGRPIFEVFPDDPGELGASVMRSLRSSFERVLARRGPDTMAVQMYSLRRPDDPDGEPEERYWSPKNLPILDESGAVTLIVHRVEDVTDFVRLKRQESERGAMTEGLRERAMEMENEVLLRARELEATNRELRSLQEHLEERVRERTRDLEVANDALRKSEDDLRQSQKLEAVGRLAGGIAHDFNNLLTVILSCVDIAQEHLPVGHPAQVEIDDIKAAGERAASLTRQLLTFSRRHVLDLEVLEVNEAVESVTAMLERVLGEDVDLRTELGVGLWRTRADRSQLEQVIMNLVVNARDAMPEGGQVTVKTENVESPGDLDDLPAGQYVRITVSDNGVGMDEATGARAFEPFFTTKEPGKGTGLGLSMVFGIVRRFGGTVLLSSQVGVGTRVRINLQAAVAPVASRSPALVPSQAVGTEAILLVEDDDRVRRIVAQILGRVGYEVVEARGAHEGLQLAEVNRHKLKLLLTDVVMPRANGKLLAERVTELCPRVKILYMSGYTDDVLSATGSLTNASFLQKPFTPETLTRKVREVLDLRPNPPS
jgi:signal transduction histidine kinase